MDLKFNLQFMTTEVISASWQKALYIFGFDLKPLMKLHSFRQDLQD
jgi:hypothetical protein